MGNCMQRSNSHVGTRLPMSHHLSQRPPFVRDHATSKNQHFLKQITIFGISRKRPWPRFKGAVSIISTVFQPSPPPPPLLLGPERDHYGVALVFERWISQLVSLILIRKIAIYSMDSPSHLWTTNQGLIFNCSVSHGRQLRTEKEKISF